MEKIVIEGGRKLSGEVAISGAKNAALPVMMATLLASGEHVIGNVPGLRDVDTVIHLLENLGARVDFNREKGQLRIDTSRVDNLEADYDLVRTMRASCLVLGPLLSKFGTAKVSLPGGCAIGERPINLHLKGLEALGAKVKLEHGYVIGQAKRLKGNHVYFDIPTVTGTENIMMAAVLAEGETVIENAAREPEISNLADQLRKMGGLVEGDGTDTITVKGVDSLRPAEIDIIPDRIEAGTFLIAAAITGGEVTVKGCVPIHSEPLIMKLLEAGVEMERGEDWIKVKEGGEYRGVDVKTAPYPGFPTDMQAQILALMSLSKGMSVISEMVFENRFMHVAELKRMGADIHIEGKSAFVKGVSSLSGAPLMATDLRASASLIVAALAATGESVISRIYHLDRGYEKIEEKLSSLGALIRRVK